MGRHSQCAAWVVAAFTVQAGIAASDDPACLDAPGTIGAVRTLDAVPALLPPPPPRGSYAFTHVNVIPMEGEPVLPDHTVLVEGDRITRIGPADTVPVPPGAVAIDGFGRWLTPGLVDAHTHERALPEWPDDVAGNLAMYLANGVTSILNMGDFTGDMIRVRAAVAAGEMAGPNVYVGHFVRGTSDGGTSRTIVTGTDDARALVNRASADRYDFIKVYDGVPASSFDALVSAGREAGLPVLGHAVRSVGLMDGLGRGQVMVAHVSPFLAVPGTPSEVARRVASSGASVVATLFVMDLISGFGLDGLAGRDAWARVLAQDGVEYMDDRALDAWLGMYRFRSDLRAARDSRSEVAAMQRLVKAFTDQGVLVLAGADTIGVPGVVPGFSIHGELRQLRASGLSPWQVLAAGTRNAGAFAERHFRSGSDRFGVVAEGARADLLLLEGNPLDDLGVLERPAVMAAGRWYPRDLLLAQLETLRARR